MGAEANTPKQHQPKGLEGGDKGNKIAEHVVQSGTMPSRQSPENLGPSDTVSLKLHLHLEGRGVLVFKTHIWNFKKQNNPTKFKS